ncbi:radical SAM protein [Nostoc ellipsosporum NOK]|nr:radical SAM protein [Nostoc ellipsosporum NOK]
MSVPVFLITPPFTQLNTPYPATAYLKGFLNTKNIHSFQSDLGIEVTIALFCRQGLQQLFDRVGQSGVALSPNASRMVTLQQEYIHTIDDVILFLQGHNPTLAHRICKRDFLPEASRFEQLGDLDWAFGSMGTQDMAKHFATMYLEDISDLITGCVDVHFGFSRYAEKLGRSANSFDELYNSLQQPYSFIDELLIGLLQSHLERLQPKLVAISVPFPGNLYMSLRCGQWIKKNYPNVTVAMGGGFANTELRSLTDPRVFEFYDFITLDDGEAPLEQLVNFVEGNISTDELKRTFMLREGSVQYVNNANCSDYKQAQVGTPDYSDLLLDKYISAIEVVNPMHRMWSDGRWNKLTMAHGCYWGKCTFCDISLDYIKLYEPVAASLLVDRMEEMIRQTKQNGFHFVDEAAPPALMRAVALEIIRRKLTVSWWANVRFEKSFTRDLCVLLKQSGCIAISGGLEVASDRLLTLIRKGITVAQVAQVNKNFTEAGIMVHAYLMYGFPTQTEQETIDSLDMVRQMFATGILQSAFWHLFTMTAHSPVGMQPEKFNVKKAAVPAGTFANNDLVHIDETGADHEAFAFGLKKSLLNYMHGIGLKEPLQKWFDFKIPKPSVAPDYIEKMLEQEIYTSAKPSTRIVYLGQQPTVEHFTKSKKGSSWEMTSFTFQTKRAPFSISVGRGQGEWLAEILKKVSVDNPHLHTLQEVKDSYEAAGLDDFELFWDNKPVNTLWKAGLLAL